MAVAVLGGSVGKKPILNRYKFNTDGSYIGNLGKARGGGIIKNHDGNWVGGFGLVNRNNFWCCC